MSLKTSVSLIRRQVGVLPFTLNRCYTAETIDKPIKTSLYDFHVANHGKIVNFSGYLLPVQYNDLSISASHLHTRKSASVFDVSHMLQTYVRGNDAIECFESITTADIRGLSNGCGTLTVFTNGKGRILDDLIVNKVADDLLYVVSNAGCKIQDKNIIQETIERFKNHGKSVEYEFLETADRALLAVQGPEAVKAVQSISTVKLDKLYFMMSVEADVGGVPGCRITRCGYTGEDGVEISIPAQSASMIAEMLLANKKVDVKLAGLGARDTLRLEAGMCLYGNDIDVNTTPIEAGLAWLVAKRRREQRDFPGANIILYQLANGVTRRRVGLKMFGGPPARHDVLIYSNGKEIGRVTSGAPSPSVGYNIAMGYVLNNFISPGTQVELKIRGKMYAGEVVKLPFVKSNYYTKSRS